MTDTVDSTAVEDAADDMPSRELATRDPSVGRLAVTPQADASELVARLAVIKSAMDTAMVDGIDYGRIPGVNKPTLLKPGSEKLGVLFQLDVQIENTKTWGPGDHLTVESKATVYHAPTGARLASGEGACSTREKKYGKRQQQRTCPQCGVAAIIKGKQEYGGGWVCFKKKDGCGAKYPDTAPEIVEQQVGEIDNPDLPDTWNTVIKMAAKRARVDAILAATGASALFTQDAEDIGGGAASDPAPTAADPEHPHGPAAESGLATEASLAVLGFCGGDRDIGLERWASIKRACGGYLPHAVAAALCAAAGTPQAPDPGLSA